MEDDSAGIMSRVFRIIYAKIIDLEKTLFDQCLMLEALSAFGLVNQSIFELNFFSFLRVQFFYHFYPDSDCEILHLFILVMAAGVK